MYINKSGKGKYYILDFTFKQNKHILNFVKIDLNVHSFILTNIDYV